MGTGCGAMAESETQQARGSQKRHITLGEKDLLEESVIPGYGVLLFASYQNALQVASQDGGNSASSVAGWTLGLPFMKKSYIALNYGSASSGWEPRIGLAPRQPQVAERLEVPSLTPT